MKELRYFIAVAEELNFTRAAQKLHLSQPALSVPIRHLDRDIGATLLAAPVARWSCRRGAGLYEARAAAGRPRALARARADSPRGSTTATLRLVYTASVAYRALPLILDDSPSGRHGSIRCHGRSGACGRSTLSSSARPTSPRPGVRGRVGPETEVLRREPLAAFMSARHPLAGLGTPRGRRPERARGRRRTGGPRPGFHALVGRLCASTGSTLTCSRWSSSILAEPRAPPGAPLRHLDQLFVGPESDDRGARLGAHRPCALRRRGRPDRPRTVRLGGDALPAVARALEAGPAAAAREGWDAPSP